MKNLTGGLTYENCFNQLLAFTKAIFDEKNIVFEDENNFWFIRIMIHYLTKIFVDNKTKKSDSEFKRVIINLPPRHYKSLIVSVIFPAWILGVDSTSQIIVASHNRRLSSSHLSECKAIIANSPAFQLAFSNVALSKKHNRASEFKIDGESGGVIAASIASGAIGFGADFIIADDPHNPSDVYSQKRLDSTTNSFKNNIFSRLNSQKVSSMIVVMQRLHVDDLTGTLLKNGNWTQLSLPLMSEVDQIFKIFNEEIVIEKGKILNTDIFDEKAINDLRAEIGLSNFNAQYQQNPKALDFAMVSESMIQYYDKNTEGNYIIINNNKKSDNFENFSNKGNFSSNFEQNNQKTEKITGNNDIFYKTSSNGCQNSDIFEKNDHKQNIKNLIKPSENALKRDSDNPSFEEKINNNNDTNYIIISTNQNNNNNTQNTSQIIHSWDTANSAQKNNFTVGTTWEIKNDHYFLIDVYRKQVDYVDLKKIVINQYEKYGGTILIEDKVSGSALIQDLSATTDIPIIGRNPTTSKESRLSKVLHFFERREIFFPKYAHWLENLKDELLRFPYSKYDDQIDSITQFLLWVGENKEKKKRLISLGKL